MTSVTSPMLRPAISPLVPLVLALAAWAGPATAQQPSPAQVNAIRQACRADYQAHCASVPTGGAAALACLKQNVAALSPPCQKAVGAVEGAAVPAAAPTEERAETPAPAAPPAAVAPAPAVRQTTAMPPPGPAVPPRSELAILRNACGRDYQVHCPGVRPGGGQVIECLVANQAALSPPCRRELALARPGL